MLPLSRVLCTLIARVQDLIHKCLKSSYAKNAHAVCHLIYFTYSKMCQMWPEIARAAVFPELLCFKINLNGFFIYSVIAIEFCMFFSS